MARYQGATPVPPSEKLLLSVKEAAGMCSIGRDAALRYVHLGEQRGGWRSIQTEGRYLIPRKWLEAWVEIESARQSAG